MQEKLKNAAHDIGVQDDKQVILSIQTRVFVLHGSWHWEMQSDAVYCNDVMSFPADFEGSRGIIHPDDLTRVEKALEVMQDMEVSRLSFRIITTFGEVKYISGEAVSLEAEELASETDEAGSEPSDRKEAFRQMEAQKEAAMLRLRTALAETSEKLYSTGTWYLNKSTGEAWYSDAVFRIYGLLPQSLNAHGNTFNSFIHPEDQVAVIEAFEQAYADEVPLHIEYRIVQPGGAIRQVRQVTGWSFNEGGQLLFSGTLRDITEMAELTEALDAAENHNRLQQQLVHFAEKQAASGYWFMNLVTRKTIFSPNYLRIHGLKTPFVPSHAIFLELAHPDDRQKVEDAIGRALKEHVLPETAYRIIRPDGKQRYLQLSGKLSVQKGSELVMMGVVTDITAQISLEKNIQELSDTLTLQNITAEIAEQNAGISSVIWLPDGSMVWSDGFYRMLGHRPKSIEPRQELWQRSIHPEDAKAFNDAVKLAQNNQQVNDIYFRMISRSGIRQLKLTFRQVVQDDRQAIVGLVQDISAQVALQQQAKKGEHYAALLENVSKDLLLLTDTENNIISIGWNRTAEELTGYKKDDILHANLFDVFPKLHTEGYQAQLQTALNGKEVSIHKVRNSYLAKSQNYQLIPFKDENDKVLGVLHVVCDISRELELQQQLSERLSFIENLLDATIDRIIVLDQHMDYLYWNPKAEEYYGMNKQRVLGKNILEVFPGFRSDPSYQEFRRALKGETVHIPASVKADLQEYCETYLIPIKDDDDAVNAVLWIVHDLSREMHYQLELQQHVKKLQEEQRRLNEAQSVGHVGSFEWNMVNSTVSWSDELYRLHGLKPQEEVITLDRVISFAHGDDAPVLSEMIDQWTANPGVYSVIHRIIRADGVERTVVRQVQSYADEEGTVTHLRGTVQDITELRKTELELKDSKLFMEQVVDATPGFIMVFNLLANKIEYVNRSGYKGNDERYQETLLINYEQILLRAHPEDRQELHDYIHKFRLAQDDEVHSLDYRVVKGAEVIWYRSRGKVFKRDAQGAPTHYVSIVLDITEQKNAEQQLAEQSYFLRRIAETVPDMVSVMELPSRKVQFLNKEVFAANGFDPDVMARKSVQELANVIHPDDQQALAAYFEKLSNASDEETVTAEYRAQQHAGQWSWFLARGKVFQRNDAGQVVRILNVIENITTRKKAEQEILQLKDEVARKATDKYRSIFNAIDQGFYLCEVIFDEHNRPVDILYLEENPAAVRIVGKSFVGKTLREMDSAYEAYWYEIWGDVALTGKSRRMEQYAAPDKKWFDFFIDKVGEANSRQLVVLFQDVTERKKAEESLA